MNIELLAEHLLSDENEFEIIKGKVHCESCNRFWLDICPSLKLPSNDMSALCHFPHVSIPSFMRYDIRVSICTYTQRQIFNLLEALHWVAVCDVTFVSKTERWRTECQHLFELAMYRAVELGMSENTLDILDYDLYRTVSTFAGTDIESANATYGYCHDIAAFVTEFLKEMYKDIHPVPPGPRVNYERLKKLIVSHGSMIDDKDLVRSRRTYFENFIVTPALKRVHRRKHPLNATPASRDIIVAKHEKFYMMHGQTKEEILRCRLATDETISIIDRISLDCLFNRECVAYASRGGDPVQPMFGPGYPNIRYMRTRGVWSVQASHDSERVGYPSLIEAFCYARLKNPVPKKGSVPLSCLDEYILTD